MSRISYTRPSISDLEVEYATDAARNGWGAQCYDYIHRFEASFATHLGVEHCIATSSCTGAFHMGLAALGIGPGDEVILAATNWIATAAPIAHVGATPVFVDVDPESWCIDPAAAEAAITPKTRAIVATHLYGNLCNMEQLLAIGERHQIDVIEDAAEAIGSQYDGKRAGSLGRFGTFSFHGTKTMTTGEGGMFVTNDSELYETVLTLSNHGRSRTQARQFWPDMIGFKYKISNIQAAIGCAQVERIDSLIERKREILAAYKARLSSLNNQVVLNPEPDHVVNGAWMPTVVFSKQTGITQGEAIAAFQAANIDARVFFSPLTELEFFEARHETYNASDIAGRAINLPSYHDMTDADIDDVCAVVKKLIDD